MGAKALGMSTC